MDLLKTFLPLIIIIAISLAQKAGTNAAKDRKRERRRKRRRMPQPPIEPSTTGPEKDERPSLSEWIQQMQDGESSQNEPEQVLEPEPVIVTEVVPPRLERSSRNRHSSSGGRPPNDSDEESEKHIHWSDAPVEEMEEAVEITDTALRSARRRSKDSARSRRGGARIKIKRGDIRHAIVLREVLGRPVALKDQ